MTALPAVCSMHWLCWMPTWARGTWHLAEWRYIPTAGCGALLMLMETDLRGPMKVARAQDGLGCQVGACQGEIGRSCAPPCMSYHLFSHHLRLPSLLSLHLLAKGMLLPSLMPKHCIIVIHWQRDRGWGREGDESERSSLVACVNQYQRRPGGMYLAWDLA